VIYICRQGGKPEAAALISSMRISGKRKQREKARVTSAGYAGMTAYVRGYGITM
jgi:hypothetical protein